MPMKSPDDISRKLSKQWQRAEVRQQALLAPEIWPIRESISRPSADDIKRRLNEVQQHIVAWRGVTVGEVVWQRVRYRQLHDELEVPLCWQLGSAAEWVAAANDRVIDVEYSQLQLILPAVALELRSVVISQRRIIAGMGAVEVIKCAEVASQLTPGCANGVPLRALTVAGIDTKFFERYSTLLIHLLDQRFDGAVRAQGLEQFLGAARQDSQWLLIADLDGGLLPFEQVRVRDKELYLEPLPGKNILIVENERCLHLLPKLKNTIAILGAGLNLAWMSAAWLADRRLGYWGDIDTWGLAMLAIARNYQPGLQALLMTPAIFETYAKHHAVVEPTPNTTLRRDLLSLQENRLFEMLVSADCGRLEQEFLPAPLVGEAVQNWYEAD
jgi:hypothetical protein